MLTEANYIINGSDIVNVELSLVVQVRHKIGRSEPDYVLSPAALFAGKEQQRYAAENIGAARQWTPRRQSGGEQHDAAQQKRGKCEELYHALSLCQKVIDRLMGYVHIAEEERMQTHKDAAKLPQPCADC